MDVIEFLEHPEVARLSTDFQEARAKKEQASYNLFTISSYNSYLENFHSDIIASLLDPNERHGEGSKFLQLFIDWLNASKTFQLDASLFNDATVSREEGRLDIWIRDKKTRYSIIIENKINGAVDMDDQMDRYYAHAEASGYKTIAVLYLTLDGNKPAPPCSVVPPELIHNVAAFTNTADDMVNGWLRPCLKKPISDDAKSFLHQYIKLLEHLANKSMNNETMEQFYHFVSQQKGTETLNSIMEMASRLTLHRANKFAAAITDYAPFKKHGRWKPTYLCYERFWDGEHELKLDVYYEDDGSAYLAFWNTQVAGPEGRKIITDKLTKIGRLSEFVVEPKHWNDNAYGKHFVVGSEEYADIAAVDAAHISYTKALLADLRKL